MAVDTAVIRIRLAFQKIPFYQSFNGHGCISASDSPDFPEILCSVKCRVIGQKHNHIKAGLIETEFPAYRLAYNIKKTQKRANALQNITIPRFERLAKEIQEYLEEKEREDFTRLKVIKKMKG